MSVYAFYADVVGDPIAPMYPLVVVGLFLALTFRPPRPLAAAIVGLGLTVASAYTTSSSTPLMRMCGAIIPGLYAFKLFVIARTRPELSTPARIAFFFWPDMDARAFVCPQPARVDRSLVHKGLWGTVTGIGAIVGATTLHLQNTSSAAVYVLALLGGSLLLHFGVLRLGAAGLHAGGYAVPPLFTSPLGSASLRAFWGGKWNAAFANLMRELFVAPLGPQRKGLATALAFIASAGLHEMAITWPLDAGYGRPTLYFIIQALAHRIEHALPQRRWGRVMTFLWVAVPVPLLFPYRFATDILLSVPLALNLIGGA